MKSLNRKNSNGLVAIAILHRRPDYAENVRFIKTYFAENNPELDLETIFSEAFIEAYPDWPILEIHMINKK
jgi:hypothetical protein